MKPLARRGACARTAQSADPSAPTSRNGRGETELVAALVTRFLPIDAIDPRDDGFGAQLGDDSAEMLEVIDLEIDRQLGEIG